MQLKERKERVREIESVIRQGLREMQLSVREERVEQDGGGREWVMHADGVLCHCFGQECGVLRHKLFPETQLKVTETAVKASRCSLKTNQKGKKLS